jgi:hypothetical protein
VISEPAGAAGFVKKHVGQPRYEDFELEAGFAMAKPFYDWISAAWNMSNQRKSGAIVNTDFKLTPVSERQFVDALIAETTIPALDGSSKDPAFITVKLSPEYTRAAKPTGTVGKTTPAAQKAFLPSNFRVEIDGLDCSKVNKVDSFTIKQSVAAAAIGDARDYEKQPGSIEFPNLKITFAEVTAKTWDTWFEDFVVKGNNGEANEKKGAIVLLSADRKTTLARITLHNLGIFALRRHRQVANDEAIQRVTAELYCERMELQVGAAAPAVKPAPEPRPVVPPPPPARPVRPIGPIR